MFILMGCMPSALTGCAGSTPNPSDRLAEIRGKIADAEGRVRDLEGLLTSLILGTADQYDIDPSTPGIQHPDGLISADHPQGDLDANIVRQELYRARAFEGELRTAENF